VLNVTAVRDLENSGFLAGARKKVK